MIAQLVHSPFALSNRVFRLMALALLSAGASACVRTVQAWPPPLSPATEVVIRFAHSRSVAFDRGSVADSATGVRELRGQVVSLRGDTLVLIVASEDTRGVGSSRAVGRLATIPLDQSTTVSFTQMDGWKFAYGLLAGVVLIFAGLVMSSS